MASEETGQVSRAEWLLLSLEREEPQELHSCDVVTHRCPGDYGKV